MLSPARLEAILLRTGISAKALTAAGCDAEDIDQVVSDVSDYLITNSGDLNNAHADYANARRDRDILARTVRSGTGAAQDVTEYQAAVSNLASAASARQTALDAIFDAGCDSLTQNEVDLLTVIRANLHWNETSRIDMEFLTITRIESNWVELDEVLEYERYCGEVGESMDQDIQAFLTSARANATVSAAASRLSDNLNANKTAWDIAVDIYGQ
jgi:hypothetical protein